MGYEPLDGKLHPFFEILMAFEIDRTWHTRRIYRPKKIRSMLILMWQGHLRNRSVLQRDEDAQSGPYDES